MTFTNIQDRKYSLVFRAKPGRKVRKIIYKKIAGVVIGAVSNRVEFSQVP